MQLSGLGTMSLHETAQATWADTCKVQAKQQKSLLPSIFLSSDPPVSMVLTLSSCKGDTVELTKAHSVPASGSSGSQSEASFLNLMKGQDLKAGPGLADRHLVPS